MDVYHYFGNDIVTSPTGDLQTVDGITKSQQRILRRLLTNPGTYIFHPTYGAGLPRYIGQALTTAKFQEIKGLIISQIFLEESVAKTPPPVITLSSNQTFLNCTIQYTDAATLLPQILSFQVTN
jgi:hypothetical protein